LPSLAFLLQILPSSKVVLKDSSYFVLHPIRFNRYWKVNF